MIEHGKTYKYLDKYCGGFYNPRRALTYGRPMVICCGSRSIGKSTGWAMFAILEFLQYGRKWIYVRRTKDEVSLTAPSFFDNAVDIINRFDDFKIDSISYKAGVFTITRGEEVEECGIAIPLSLEHKYKSSNLSEYYTILYDEFIARFQTEYLGSADTPDTEYRKLISLYQTVDRGIGSSYRNDTSVIMLGNTATIYNPILIKLGIPEYVSEDSKMIAPKGKLWLLERVKSVEATSEIKNSFAYQLADEIEKDYAYENRNSEDFDTSFVCKPSGKYRATFRLDGRDYGLYYDNVNLYIGKPRKDVTAYYYAIDLKSHTGDGYNLGLLTKLKNYPYMKILKDKFSEGKLFFDSIPTYRTWMIPLQFQRS